MTKLREDRLAKGLCPDCGAEAAPYRLCDRCRFGRLLLRILNKAAANGDVIKSKKGTASCWQSAHTGADWKTEYYEAQPGDRRLRPRLRNIPIDVEQQLVKIFKEVGKPLRLDEIYAAWGKLRLRAGRTSAAMDLAYIVAAGRKRRALMARRAERARKQVAAEERHRQQEQRRP